MLAPSTNPQAKSKCCGAPMQVNVGVTMYYFCTKCNQPCDPKPTTSEPSNDSGDDANYLSERDIWISESVRTMVNEDDKQIAITQFYVLMNKIDEYQDRIKELEGAIEKTIEEFKITEMKSGIPFKEEFRRYLEKSLSPQSQ